MQTEPIVVPELQHVFHTREMMRIFDQLHAEPLWQVWQANGDALQYERSTGLLWDGKPNQQDGMDGAKGKGLAAASALGGLQGWRLPTLEEVKRFSACQGASIRQYKTKVAMISTGTWLTVAGTWNCDCAQWSEGSQHWGALVLVNDFVGDLGETAFIELCVERTWSLGTTDVPNADLLVALKNPSARKHFATLDHVTTRLPKLEDAWFDDPMRGLWEVWNVEQERLNSWQVLARNPADDIRDQDVAIDFGTSSTVVAYSEHGRRRLLRIGIDRFDKDEQAENYENPTALEFKRFKPMLAAWQRTSYRPSVEWDDVCCSHAALNSLQEAAHDLVQQVLTGLKPWALRGEQDPRIYFRDGQGEEFALTPLTARNPVMGTPLQVSEQDPFDPIELYAWFLGMNINWRGRGIFLRYYMSFPVAYPEHVRDKILASFRRGLQRSLPATLVTQTAFSRFRVEELATEPAAYAAAALPELGIEPSEEGEAYAVFDFGGGTTDFEFGKYLLPSGDDDEVEEILEHYGAGGDVFLGGEHLLANMAYLVFKHNLGLCKEKSISFSRPQDADVFPGHEMYVENSRIALTNTAVLIAKLRPFWEGVQPGNPNLTLTLLARNGDETNCALAIPLNDLNDYLSQRIGQGIRSFFFAMRKAFDGTPPAMVHVLLAGNASRSQIVSDYFLNESGNALFGETADILGDAFIGTTAPTITVHAQPPGLESQPPMGKTGVALGLLRLCPGGVVVTRNARRPSADRETPFAYFVGRIRHGKFHPLLSQAEPYNEWNDLGQSRDRVMKIAYTQSALAMGGAMSEDDQSLHQRRLELGAGTGDLRIFARAISPDTIEICAAASKDAIQSAGDEERHIITFA